MENDKERKVRLRSRKPAARSERPVYCSGYKLLMHYARMSTVRKRRLSGPGVRATRTRPYFQRCAIRVVYSKNASRGQWRAHGRYLVRESVAFDGGSRGIGFDEKGEAADIPQRLEDWQRANDERLWKIIISPEFGDRANLKTLTRDLLARMAKDLATPLEWAAVAHYNTEHPHVHVAVRGVRADGTPLRMSRDYIRQGIREYAQGLCTRQLGYRSERDAMDSRRSEIHQDRYTSLDAAIKRDGIPTDDGRFLAVPVDPTQGSEYSRLLKRHMTERLLVLKMMGLVKHTGPNLWRVRADFEEILRAMQRSADRQKTLAAHGALMSDERLQVVVTGTRDITTLEGRILVHGEEDSSGRAYLMLEGTDGRVHYIYYTPEMDALRNHGSLRTNSFIRLRKLFTGGSPALEIDDMGDSEALLRNKHHLRATAERLIQRDIVPQDNGWGGWLGRYQKALQDAVTTLEISSVTKQSERSKNRGLGR
jgi:type IV secretory pathway VirD2 relaxase